MYWIVQCMSVGRKMLNSGGGGYRKQHNYQMLIIVSKTSLISSTNGFQLNIERSDRCSSNTVHVSNLSK